MSVAEDLVGKRHHIANVDFGVEVDIGGIGVEFLGVFTHNEVGERYHVAYIHIGVAVNVAHFHVEVARSAFPGENDGIEIAYIFVRPDAYVFILVRNAK